jgi:CRP-like cAMP-binding protein
LAYNKAFFKNQKNFKKLLNKNKDDLRRNFTVRAIETCDLLTLSLDDLEKMMFEFPDVYYELINDASETLLKHEKLKAEEIHKKEMEKLKMKS